ncbi:50S ribosomal protein L18 [Candidatus Woesearchaeota archaeon]|nr:50S ribosomal protein L18 [Candidatus Woesearchaeota archaeon]
MAKNNSYTVPYRRKRQGRTSYQTRLKIIKSGKPRLVVRKSLRNIRLQIIEYAPNSDKILFSANSSELRKLGWKGSLSSTPAAYLTGYLLANKMKKKLECVVDIGMNVSVKGCVLYAAVKGAADGGLSIPFSEDVVPSEARICGEHIANFAKSIKADKEKYAKQFSKCLKDGLEPENLPAHFNDIKSKIGGK